jgi:hypothetical protein
MTEAFLDHGDLQPRSTPPPTPRNKAWPGRKPPRIKPLRSGQYLQQQDIVLDRRRHRTGVIQGQLDRHEAGMDTSRRVGFRP